MRLLYLFLLILLTFGVAAQNDANLPVIDTGDTLNISLDGGDIAQYTLALEPGQPLLLTTESTVPHDYEVIGSEFDFSFEQISSREDTALTGWAEVSDAGPMRSGPGPYTLTVVNTADTAGEITLSVTPMPSQTIELGERVRFDADTPRIFEIQFEAEAGQHITITGISDDGDGGVRYRIASVDEDGAGADLTWMGINLNPVSGLELHRGGTYRVIVELPQLTDEAETPSGYVEIRESATYTGDITVGETVEGTAPPAIFEYDLELDQYEAVYITFESEGAQTYIYTPDGDLLTGFGHAAIAHSFTQMRFIAPEVSTYTFYAYNPWMSDIFSGPYALSVEPLAVTTLADEPVTLDLMPEETHYLLAEVESDTTYTLSLISGDEVTGGAAVSVYDPRTPQEPLLDIFDEDTLPTPDPFIPIEDGTLAIELRAFRDFEGSVTVNLAEID